MAFIAVQGSASSAGRGRVEAAVQALDPSVRVLDVAMTAFPAQPLCWAFVAIEEGKDSYRLRRGNVNLAPGLLSGPAEFVEADASAAPDGVALAPPWQGDLTQLRMLARIDCHVNAWLRFARMPAVGNGMAGDMRFASTPRGNFTTLDIGDARTTPCGDVPRWGYPRADLLAP